MRRLRAGGLARLRLAGERPGRRRRGGMRLASKYRRRSPMRRHKKAHLVGNKKSQYRVHTTRKKEAPRRMAASPGQPRRRRIPILDKDRVGQLRQLRQPHDPPHARHLLQRAHVRAVLRTRRGHADARGRDAVREKGRRERAWHVAHEDQRRHLWEMGWVCTGALAGMGGYWFFKRRVLWRYISVVGSRLQARVCLQASYSKCLALLILLICKRDGFK